jgi:hypothetical protein
MMELVFILLAVFAFGGSLTDMATVVMALVASEATKNITSGMSQGC